MALLTAGTKLTTSCSALLFQPSGMSATDLGTLNELIKPPSTTVNPVINKKAYIQNGRLFVPGERTPQGYLINPGDYILVDGAGFPFIVPGEIFSTSWQHS
jgi:hypothetical protein